MQSDTPKQYLRIADKTILELTIDCFERHPQISGIVLVLAKDDSHWSAIADKYSNIVIAEGGQERFQSVLSGLKVLSEMAKPDDWVLVHDAARPCLRQSDIDRLISTLSNHAVGGLLGLPMADTVKRCQPGGDVLETVPRHDLWRALTPQMFRLTTLKNALQQALADQAVVTDEASAIERTGLQPQMVAGQSDNIKITRPEDLELARRIMSTREKACE